MRWTQTQADCLMKLAETGTLTPQQLQATAKQAPLQPSQADWLLMAKQVLALGGALLLAAGVIYFFAYNWADLPRFAKLDLAMAALTIAVGAAVCCRLWGIAWRAAVVAAMLCCGALLALIGQIYQTGADVWELFAAWAALSLPLALLSRSSAGWVLWLLVANTALGFGLERSPWLFPFMIHSLKNNLFVLASSNLLLLALLEAGYQRLLVVPRRHVLRLAALAGVLPLMLGASMAWWAMDELGIMVPVFFVCAAVLIWLYYRWRRDVFILAIASYAIVTVLVSMIARGMNNMENPFSWVMLAVILAVMSGGVAMWLMSLYREQMASSQTTTAATAHSRRANLSLLNNTLITPFLERQDVLQSLLSLNAIDAKQVRAAHAASTTPWWLSLILTLVACIAAGIVMIAIGIATHFEGVSAGVLGVVCLVGALIWLRREEAVFMQQLGLVFSLSGQTLILWTIAKNNIDNALPYVFSALLAALLTLPRTTALHRTVCALVAWGSLWVATLRDFTHSWNGFCWPILTVLAGAVALVLWTQRARWTQWLGGRQSGLFAAWAQASALLSMAFSLPTTRQTFFSIQLEHWHITTAFWLYRGGTALLFVGTCVWLTRQLAPKQRWLLLAGMVVFTAIGWRWSGLMMTAALTLAAFQACQRVWFSILLAWLVMVVGNYYYDLSTTLLNKSISMMVLGAALLALRWVLVHQTQGKQA